MPTTTAVKRATRSIDYTPRRIYKTKNTKTAGATRSTFTTKYSTRRARSSASPGHPLTTSQGSTWVRFTCSRKEGQKPAHQSVPLFLSAELPSSPERHRTPLDLDAGSIVTSIQSSPRIFAELFKVQYLNTRVGSRQGVLTLTDRVGSPLPDPTREL